MDAAAVGKDLLSPSGIVEVEATAGSTHLEEKTFATAASTSACTTPSARARHSGKPTRHSMKYRRVRLQRAKAEGALKTWKHHSVTEI